MARYSKAALISDLCCFKEILKAVLAWFLKWLIVVVPVILLGLLGALMMEGGRAEIRKVSDYFPDLNGDLTKVTWAHAVNSKAKLDAALKGEVIVM